MMFFSRLKTTLILAVCVVGALLCVPNFAPAPADWVPWRSVRLGLDLRGGSYLLLEVDMSAVVKERLDNLVDAARTALRGKVPLAQAAAAQPAENRVVLRVRDPGQQDEAIRLLREVAASSGAAEFDVAGQPDGTVALSLSPQRLRELADSAVLQSIEIVRRRVDETGVVEPQIARQGENRIVVQLPGIEDPNRIKELLGRTARMTFRLLDEGANLQGPPPPGVDFLPEEGRPDQRLPVRRRIEVDGASLTDARPGQDSQNGQWVVNFTFDSVGARRFARVPAPVDFLQRR